MNLDLDDDVDSIWESLNNRLHSKFGYTEEISKSVSSDDLSWAHKTLPEYIHWDKMNPYRLMLEFWQRKISSHLKKSANKKGKTTSEASADEVDEVDDAASGETGKYLIKFL